MHCPLPVLCLKKQSVYAGRFFFADTRHDSKALSGVFILHFHYHRTAARRDGQSVMARTQRAFPPTDLLLQGELAEVGRVRCSLCPAAPDKQGGYDQSHEEDSCYRE